MRALCRWASTTPLVVVLVILRAYDVCRIHMAHSWLRCESSATVEIGRSATKHWPSACRRWCVANKSVPDFAYVTISLTPAFQAMLRDQFDKVQLTTKAIIDGGQLGRQIMRLNQFFDVSLDGQRLASMCKQAVA